MRTSRARCGLGPPSSGLAPPPTRLKGVAQYAHRVLSGRVRLAPQVGQWVSGEVAVGVAEAMGAEHSIGCAPAWPDPCAPGPPSQALFRPAPPCTIAPRPDSHP